MRVFCSSNILCQEILSSELSLHRKQLLSELVRLEGFITLTDQFNLSPTDRYNTPYSY